MPYKPVSVHDKLRKKALADPETRALYEAYKVQIDLAMKLKKARIKRKMTQDDVAEIMHTKKPAISRLEAGDDIKNFPSLLTLIKFASAIGYELKVGLVPMKITKDLKQGERE
ncbi:MAG: hypothetical protein A3F12_01390 [Gammaproteobacteria bacterium RIFCSPHIGHO2_12_FULL_38_14]|nr:MAG: hypothetical protein A3F12_01390 [Gammaproteobacteria bacterium RIFCSPHIGHO2_12_FULL_38_14]